MHGKRLLILFVFGVVCLALAPTARAVPPPMTEAEMMDAADLVVDADCVAIVCDGPPVTDAEKITTTYVSTLFPTFSYKGGLPNSIQIRGVEYDYFGMPPVGGWYQGAVPEGWAGKLYLEQLPDNTYTKVWWNAMEEAPATSNPLPLPSCVVPDLDGGVETDGGLDGAIPGDAAPDSGPQDPSSPGSGCQCNAPCSAPPAGFLLWLVVGLLWIVGRRR